MKAIDFRFRPNTPDAVDGLIHSPFFGDMCAFFNYPDRAWSASLDKIVEIMDEHERPMAAPVPTWASWK